MSCMGYYGVAIEWFVGKDYQCITVYVNGTKAWEKEKHD